MRGDFEFGQNRYSEAGCRTWDVKLCMWVWEGPGGSLERDREVSRPSVPERSLKALAAKFSKVRSANS